MRKPRFLVMLAWMVSSLATADTDLRFEDYPALDTFSGDAAKVRLADSESRQYATMLKSAAHRKPNFAGHYVLANWGCGASCVMAAAVDLKTGSVTWLPFTVCCWDADVPEPLVFKLQSRLLVVHGSRNETEKGTYYYQFDGGKFLFIATRE
jgi:hypothetical protein